MNKTYLVLALEDFGHPIHLYRSTDLFAEEASADYEATMSVTEGSREVYLFELKRVYRPKVKEGSRGVEEVFVGPDGE